MKLLSAILAASLFSLAAQAQDEDDACAGASPREGALDWSVLAQTVERQTRHQGEVYVAPEFPEAVQALDGVELEVQGYMYQLYDEAPQTEFLLIRLDISCYRMTRALVPSTPYEDVIEIHAPDGIELTSDPIRLRGRMSLLGEGEGTGAFYLLSDAQLVEPAVPAAPRQEEEDE